MLLKLAEMQWNWIMFTMFTFLSTTPLPPTPTTPRMVLSKIFHSSIYGIAT